jgi:hypothetical protein
MSGIWSGMDNVGEWGQGKGKKWEVSEEFV